MTNKNKREVFLVEELAQALLPYLIHYQEVPEIPSDYNRE